MSASSAERVRALRRGAERSRFLRGLALAGTALVLFAWFGGAIDFGDLFDRRRGANLVRFVTEEAAPRAVARGEQGLGAWLAERVLGTYGEALVATLCLAVAAAALAGLLGLALATWTARTALAADDPFDPRAAAGPRSLRPWLGRGARALCLLLRAVPEYLVAFLLGAFLPDPAAACLVALVLHNGGILGRLYGETLENLDQRPARAWYDAGAARLTTLAGAQLPEAFPRGLTYLVIRFESCVRESTVLGMLGFVSLGHWIVQQRAAGRYDEVLLLAGLGAVVVLAADLVSWAARGALRRR